MLRVIQKIAGDQKKRVSTARVGILHAYAHRALKSQTDNFLKNHNISSIEWGVLGILDAEKGPVVFGEITTILGVKKPFVTRILKNLEDKKYIKVHSGKQDKRTRTASLTKNGKEMISTVEKELRVDMRAFIDGASARDLLGYLRVLETIAKNHKKTNKK